MKTRNFSFELPEELIAQRPTERRGESRLLVVDRASGQFHHAKIGDIREYLPPSTLIVTNNSRVRKARIFGTSDTGGRVEFLFLEPRPRGEWLAMCTKIKKQRVGKTYVLDGGLGCRIVAEEGNNRVIAFDETLEESYLEAHGHLPLPPYIHRPDTPDDMERYQTVYAKETGSAAAPTAGLHFTEEILADLRSRGHAIAEMTLHVGLGTFLPVRTEDIEDHEMHAEHYSVSPDAAAAYDRQRRRGGPVLAVGTTSVRTLESAARPDGASLQSGYGTTDIFIYPGYQFRAVDLLLTNFHTPESSLMMLVSAFGAQGKADVDDGRKLILAAYQAAIESRYRFFSYGDAMLIR
jgi:S-adenosylmethionine:tRNA ribosyltransferase-isomerase